MSSSEQRDAALMCGTRWRCTCVCARRVLRSETTGSAVVCRSRGISYKRTFYLRAAIFLELRVFKLCRKCLLLGVLSSSGIFPCTRLKLPGPPKTSSSLSNAGNPPPLHRCLSGSRRHRSDDDKSSYYQANDVVLRLCSKKWEVRETKVKQFK